MGGHEDRYKAQGAKMWCSCGTTDWSLNFTGIRHTRQLGTGRGT